MHNENTIDEIHLQLSMHIPLKNIASELIQ